jgi:hypothetical protein
MHRPSHRVTCLGFVALSGLWVAGEARADGGYFPSNVNPASSAETTDQRALLFYEDGFTTLFLQTGYQGNSSGFSWIIPTASKLVVAGSTAVDPTRPETQPFRVADQSVFEGLHALTAPMLVTFKQGCGAFGCAGGDGSSAQAGSSEVRIFDSFNVDGYDVTDLGADDAQALVTWLNANGYRVPTNAVAVFEDYVQRSFNFVAVKFAGVVEAPQARGGDSDDIGTQGDKIANPLALRFSGAMRTFPLLISSLSTVQTIDLVLYTIDTRRYTVLNFPTVDMEIKEVFEGDDFTGWYNQRLEGAIAANGGRAFMVEFAAPVDGYQLAQALGRWPNPATAVEESWFVTRLRTRLPPEAMTEDVQLAPVAGDEASAPHRIRVVQGGEPGKIAASLPLDLTLIVALALVIQRRRRRLQNRGGH